MALRQSQPPNICFYSNKCDWSEAFIKELANTPYKQEFQFICVDTTPRSQLPTWLKQVPTLLIKNDQEPIKTNSDVLNWLYERKMKDTSRGPSTSSAPVSDEIEAWNMSEMGGKLSESYGTIVNGSGANVENSSTKNWDFGFLNGSAAKGDRTTQGIGDSGLRQEEGRGKSKKEQIFDRQMEAYQQNRESGMPQSRGVPRSAR